MVKEVESQNWQEDILCLPKPPSLRGALLFFGLGPVGIMGLPVCRPYPFWPMVEERYNHAMHEFKMVSNGLFSLHKILCLDDQLQKSGFLSDVQEHNKDNGECFVPQFSL
jgi:hypothetical protein